MSPRLAQRLAILDHQAEVRQARRAQVQEIHERRRARLQEVRRRPMVRLPEVRRRPLARPVVQLRPGPPSAPSASLALGVLERRGRD